MLASSEVSKTVKELLRCGYERLDPVELLRQVEHGQNVLWQYAYRPVPPIEASAPEQPPLDLTNQVPQLERRQSKPDDTNKVMNLDVGIRLYRATRKERLKMSAPRYWRTRPDAFAEVWEQIEEQLTINPSAETKQLFCHLQRLHPGRFSDNQLRTLQRRVRAWRTARSVPCAGVLLPAHLLSAYGTAASESKLLT